MNWAEAGIAAGKWVLWNSVGAGAVVILVLVVQKMMGDRISARWRHNLWLLVVVRLMLPAIPGIGVSVPGWMKSRGEVKTDSVLTSAVVVAATEHEAEKVVGGPEVDASKGVEDVANLTLDLRASEPKATEELAPVDAAAGPNLQPVSTPISIVTPVVTSGKVEVRPKFSWVVGALAVWLSGTALVIAWLFFATVRLWRMMRGLKRVQDGEALRLLEECRRVVGVKRAPLLMAGANDFGPALVGLWRLRLIVPECVVEGFGRQELRAILLHELVHQRRRDVGMNYLLAGLAAVHWFNPLVWFAFARLRAERELACDEAVLAMSPVRERLTYGCTILKLLEAARGGAGMAAGAVGVIGNKGLMQRRISMIARFDRKRTGRPVAAVVLSLIVGGAAVTTTSWAQEKPAEVKPVPEVKSVAGARAAVEAAAKPPAVEAAPAPLVAEPVAPAVSGVAPIPDPLGQAVAPATPQLSPATEPPPAAPRMGGRRGTAPGGVDLSPRSIEDVSAASADAKTAERLKTPQEIKANGVPLRDVLRMIADQGKLDIVTDDQALAEAGVDLNAPVNLMLNQPRPLEQILEMSLRLASPQVDYSILNGVIFVASRVQLNAHVVTRVYDIGNVDHSTISDLLINGTGLVPRVLFVEDKLVVTASELTQRHVAKLLAAVSDHMSHRIGAQTSNRGTGAKEMRIFALKYAEAQSLKQVVMTTCSPNLTIAVDPRTNTLIVTAAKDDQEMVEQLLQKLDQPGAKDGGKGVSDSANREIQELQRLAEAVVTASQQYGPDHPRVRELAARIDMLGTEVSRWIDTLMKDGNEKGAKELRDQMDHIKALLAPLKGMPEPLRAPAAVR